MQYYIFTFTNLRTDNETKIKDYMELDGKDKEQINRNIKYDKLEAQIFAMYQPKREKS